MKPEIKSIKHGLTINLGNFEFARYDLELEIPSDQSPESVAEYAESWIKERAGKLPLSVQEKLDEALRCIASSKKRIERLTEEEAGLRRRNSQSKDALSGLRESIISESRKLRLLKAQIGLAEKELNRLKNDLGLPVSSNSPSPTQKCVASDVWAKFPQYFHELEVFLSKLKVGSPQAFTRFQAVSPDYVFVDLWLSEFSQKYNLPMYWEKVGSDSHHFLSVHVNLPPKSDDFESYDEWEEENKRAMLGAFDGVQD